MKFGVHAQVSYIFLFFTPLFSQRFQLSGGGVGIGQQLRRWRVGLSALAAGGAMAAAAAAAAAAVAEIGMVMNGRIGRGAALVVALRPQWLQNGWHRWY